MVEVLEKMNKEDLGRYLHKSLQERSYLVVIDDVWDKEAWEIFKRAFPDNKNRSQVIIITHSKDAAEHSDERTHAHKQDEDRNMEEVANDYLGELINKGLIQIARVELLRHLIGRFVDGIGSIGNSTKLQTLRCVCNQSWTQVKTEKLVNLRKLWLVGNLDEHEQEVFSFDFMARRHKSSLAKFGMPFFKRIISQG
ncbi:hypothetical protein QYF36_022793 [Acer negundo]|nr:hypothetical protein QYF36_022793 [Acer negundo]